MKTDNNALLDLIPVVDGPIWETSTATSGGSMDGGPYGIFQGGGSMDGGPYGIFQSDDSAE